MASDAQVNMAFLPLASLMHPDEGIILPQAKKLFREIKRKSSHTKGMSMPAAVNDVAIAAISVYLVNESRNNDRPLAAHQKSSTVTSKIFNEALGLARHLVDVNDRGRAAKSSSPKSTPPKPTPPSSSSSKRRSRVDDSSDDDQPPRTPSSRGSASSSKKPRFSIEITPRDRSAEMNARHAREKQQADSSPVPVRQPHTPTKSSPLKPKPSSSKGKGKAKETPTRSTARAAKRAEKRAEKAEQARRPPERPWMVPDYELAPAKIDIEQVKEELRAIWAEAG